MKSDGSLFGIDRDVAIMAGSGIECPARFFGQRQSETHSFEENSANLHGHADMPQQLAQFAVFVEAAAPAFDFVEPLEGARDSGVRCRTHRMNRHQRPHSGFRADGSPIHLALLRASTTA